MREQDRKDERDRSAERLEQERTGLGALLVLALELERDAGTEVRLGKLGRDLLLDRGSLHAFGDVGGHRHHPIAVDAIDVAHPWRRHALHEVADRHVSRLRLHP